MNNKRFVARVVPAEDAYRLYYHTKTLCTVYKNQPIYYAFFKSSEAMQEEQSYIIFSNHQFAYTPPRPGEPTLLSTYHMEQQIVMPYTPATKHLFDVDKWEYV